MSGLWVWVLALTAAGFVLAAHMVVSLAGGPSSHWVLLATVTLAATALPFVVRGSTVRRRRLAMAGTTLVVIGLAFVVLFNLQILLILADWVGLRVVEGTMDLGRKAVLLTVGAGLAILAAAWSRRPDDVLVRVALALVGVAGMVLAFRQEGRPQMVWYLALGAVWLYLGLATVIDARRPTGT